MNYGVVYDIGCGSMGQYFRHFLNPNLVKYIGLDLDLVKLHEGQTKVKYNTKFSFVLMDITHKWNKQNTRFSNDIWKTYYNNLVNLNQQADNIISVFSSQYANINEESWSNYVNEINNRSMTGTKLFIMWIDSSKIESDSKSDYYTFDKETNILTVRLPHRDEHTEPGLGEKIFKSFTNNSRNRHNWIVDTTINIAKPNIDTSLKIYDYIKLINHIVLIKL